MGQTLRGPNDQPEIQPEFEAPIESLKPLPKKENKGPKKNKDKRAEEHPAVTE